MSALHLTKDEMMAEWRLRALPDAANAHCTITIYDGLDIETHLLARMRTWYVDLIHNAPPELLAPVDIAGEISIQNASDGSGWFSLPKNAIRLSSLRLEGWPSGALIIHDASAPGASLQLSGRQRSDHRSPVAVVDGTTLMIFNPAPEASLIPLECTAIVDTPDMYHIDERALSTIQSLY